MTLILLPLCGVVDPGVCDPGVDCDPGVVVFCAAAPALIAQTAIPTIHIVFIASLLDSSVVATAWPPAGRQS